MGMPSVNTGYEFYLLYYSSIKNSFTGGDGGGVGGVLIISANGSGSMDSNKAADVSIRSFHQKSF